MTEQTASAAGTQERILPINELFGLMRDRVDGGDRANIFGNAFGSPNQARAIPVKDIHRVAQAEEASTADYKAYVDGIWELALRELRRELVLRDLRGDLHPRMSKDMSLA